MAWPDYYETNFLQPDGELGIHQAYGGYLRDRPLYRAPLSSGYAIKDFRAEMIVAQRMGIDAFQINEGGDYASDSHTASMLAGALGTSFKVMLSFDASAAGGSKTNQEIADYFNAFRSHPNVLRHSDGRLIVSCYRPESMGASRWAAVLALIGETTFFLPTFLDISTYSDYAGMLGGASVWRATNIEDFDPGNSLDLLKALCAADGIEFMSHAAPQDHRAHQQSIREPRGSRNAIAGLEYAIANTGRYLNLLTWNDYSEGHHWQPSLRTQYGYADLARYYLSWWKAGAQPTIERDALYYFHRIEAIDAVGTGVLQTAPRFSLAQGVGYDEIELLAFLTAPGRLHIGATTLDVAAGIQRLRVPFSAGITPAFKLSRSGIDIITLNSNFATRATSDYQDLLYRAGGSLRTPVTVP